MNWVYCLIIGHCLIGISLCRPDAIPIDEQMQDVTPKQDNVSSEKPSLPSHQPIVDTKYLTTIKHLRANAVIESSQPSTTPSTLPSTSKTSPVAAALYGDKLTLTTGGPNSHIQPKRYIQNINFKPISNITAKYLSYFPTKSIATTLTNPMYAYRPPAPTGAALNADLLNLLKQSNAHILKMNNKIPNLNNLYDTSQLNYDTASSRPQTLLPSIQSVYQNLNIVSVPSSTQLPMNTLPPPIYINEQQLQGELLRNQLRQQLNQLNNIGPSITLPVNGGYKIENIQNNNPFTYNPASPVYTFHTHASQMITPQYTNTFKFPTTTPATPLYTVTSDPYDHYERIPITKYTNYEYKKPDQLNEPVVQIGYPLSTSNIHLSNIIKSPNNFDTMTHSQSNKNRSEIHHINTKTQLYINNNYIDDNDDSNHEVSTITNWSTTKLTKNKFNKNNKHTNAQNSQITNDEDENEEHNENINNNDSNINDGTKNKSPTKNNDVNIVIKIDDKNAENSNNDDTPADTNKLTVSKANNRRKGGNNHGGSNHGGNNHGGNNHGSNNGMKMKRRRRKPQQTVVDHVQTIFLQQPTTTTTTTTTTPAPLKSEPIATHNIHSKLGIFEKLLYIAPIVSILKPLAFGFWTLALSPLLVVAAGGVAIAVILYPWLSLSHEHQVSAYRSRPPPVVIHKHSAPIIRKRPAIVRPIIRSIPLRRPAIVSPIIRSKPSKPYTIYWRDRSSTSMGTDVGPKTMQNSLIGVLQGQSIENPTIKKNLLRRSKRRINNWVEIEDYRDVNFRNWLLHKNSFGKNILG